MVYRDVRKSYQNIMQWGWGGRVTGMPGLQYGKIITKFRLLIMCVFTYFPFRAGEYASEIFMLYAYVFACFISIYNHFKYF